MQDYKKEIWSGDIFECEYYRPIRKPGEKYSPRSRNSHLSTEQQQEINMRNSRKNVSRFINANFGRYDLFITLTYRQEPSLEEAMIELAKFIRRVRLYRRKHCLPELKYIVVTECSKRIHHHIVMNAAPIDAIASMWECGRTLSSRMDEQGDYTGLAMYITKEMSGDHKKRWSRSRNLIKPKVKITPVNGTVKLKAPRGYKVLEMETFYSETLGEMQYLKALRIGGTDYAGHKNGKDGG